MSDHEFVRGHFHQGDGYPTDGWREPHSFKTPAGRPTIPPALIMAELERKFWVSRPDLLGKRRRIQLEYRHKEGSGWRVTWRYKTRGDRQMERRLRIPCCGYARSCPTHYNPLRRAIYLIQQRLRQLCRNRP